MTPEAAIMVLIYLLIILAIAWAADYAANRMMSPAPPPVRMVIWGIALLVILLILLRHTGLLHAAQVAMLTA